MTGTVTFTEINPSLSSVSISARNWLQARLSELGKESLQELTPEERGQIVSAAKEEGRKETSRAITTAVLASLAVLILLPIIALVAFLTGTGLISITPDSAIYPLLGGTLLAGGYGGFKLFQGIGRFFHKEVAIRWDEARQLQILSNNLYTQTT